MVIGNFPLVNHSAVCRIMGVQEENNGTRSSFG
jgi:hypothetical protein